jgi:hypothetical protein
MSFEKRRKTAFLLNLAIVVIEGVILFNCYFGFITVNGKSTGSGYLMFRFFTEDSNIFLAFVLFDLSHRRSAGFESEVFFAHLGEELPLYRKPSPSRRLLWWSSFSWRLIWG